MSDATSAVVPAVVPADADVLEATYWKQKGWIARVKKNEDDDGWAVEMIRVGDSEPALVGPWTMGRDKKNPKPMNPKDFQTLVKTASEVLSRAAAAQRAALHKSTTIIRDDFVKFRVDLDIATDEDDPHAVLSAVDVAGDVVKTQRVAPNFKLTQKSAAEFVAGV